MALCGNIYSRNLTVSVVTAVLILLSMIVTTSGQQCDSNGYRIQKLSKLFEEALVNSSDALWQLQQIYFNPSSDQNPSFVYLSVVVTINDIIIDQCNCNSCKYDNKTCGYFCAFQECSQYYGDSDDDDRDCNNGQWVFNSYPIEFQPFPIESPNLERLMTSSMIGTVFYAFDPTFYSIMKALSSSVELHNMHEDHADIKIHINTTLQINPCWDDATSALGLVLMWAKAYARANGIPDKKLDSDRSVLTYNQDVCFGNFPTVTDPSCAFALFLWIFVLFNLLILSLTLLNLRKIFLWLQRQGKQAKILYKASAIVLTFVNIITLISDVSIIVSSSLKFDVELMILLPNKVSLVLLILLLELPLVCSNTHILNETNQMNTRCQRFIHAFAFCQIIWFVHRLVNNVVISVAFFAIAPAQTLGIDALLLTTIGSGIAFVAIIIQKSSRSNGCNKQLCSFVCCTALNGFMVCGLFFFITWVYIIFVDNGLKSAGMGGLILSLIPPLTATVIGYIVKEKYFNSNSSGSENGLQGVNGHSTTQNDVDAELQETTHLLHSH